MGRMLSRAVPGHKLRVSGPPLLELVLTRASGPLCQCPARVWRIYLYTPGHVSLPRMRGVALLSACRFRSSRLRVTRARTRIHILIRAPLNGSHQPACTPSRPCLRPHYLTRPLLLATDWSAAAYAALLAETTQLRGVPVYTRPVYRRRPSRFGPGPLLFYPGRGHAPTESRVFQVSNH